MIRDALVALIAGRLNNRTDLNDKIIAELQLAQETRLEQNGKFQPWFMITEQSYEMTDPLEPRIPVPANFVTEVEEQGFWYQSLIDGKWIPLKKCSDEEGEVMQLTPGVPARYSLVGDHFTVYPAPDNIYRVRFRYAAMQPALSSNIENNWTKFAPDLMMAEVGEQMARLDLQNPKLAEAFAAAKLTAWDRLIIMHEARLHTNRDYTMGE